MHRDIIKTAPLLSQEIHAVAFTSGSVRKIDLTNVLASRNIVGVSRARAGTKKDPEVVRPILLLLKTRSTPCDTLLVGGNPLTAAEVDDLGEWTPWVITIHMANGIQWASCISPIFSKNSTFLDAILMREAWRKFGMLYPHRDIRWRPSILLATLDMWTTWR